MTGVPWSAAVLMAVIAAVLGGAVGGLISRQHNGHVTAVKTVTIGATEKCPESTADEIVVCNKVDNPYRIPKELRDSGPIPSKNQAWTTRLAGDEQTSREAAGLPDTCSPVGTGGQTGCARAAARAFKADKRAKGTNEDPNQPVQ